MDSDAAPVVGISWGFDEGVVGVCDDAVFDCDYANCAGTVSCSVGGFKIDGDKIHRVVRLVC